MCKVWFKFIFLIVLIVLFSGGVFAIKYYADVNLDLSSNGDLVMSGLTNHPSLQGVSQEFTSKSGSHWTLDIGLNESFEDYVFAVTLPEGASLNYVRGKNINIATRNNHVLIKGFASNSPFEIFVQYQLSSDSEIGFSVRNLSFIVGAIFSIILLWWFGIRGKFKKKSKDSSILAVNGFKSVVRKANVKSSEKYFDDSRLDDLSERQLAIIDLLRTGSCTQKSIEKTLKLPKSSISRNIESLRKKGLLKKEHKGLFNRISLIS